MKRLELLDYGRFIAAIIVVLHHYTYNGIANGKITSITHNPDIVDITKYGYLGVEFFFMISGFVIFNSALNRSAAKFAVSRAVRLYPSYWFAVLFTASFAVFWGGELMAVYPSMVIINLSLLQNYIGAGNVDGVYWTLFYEVKFYFAVFILLLFGLQKHLTSIFLLWPIIMLIALIAKVDHITYLGGYFSYFAAGALFAMLKDNKKNIAWLPLLITFYLCVEFSSAKAFESGEINRSPMVITAIIVVFFMFFILQNTRFVQNKSLPLSRTFGALTYPVYLIHAHFGYMFLSQFATESNKYFMYGLTIFIVISISYFMHKIIELKFANIWKGLFMHTLYPVIDLLNSTLIKLKQENREVRK